VIDDGSRAERVFEDVVLSLEERLTLAEMAAGVDDPWLAGQLLGTVPPPPGRSFELPTCWVGIVLLMTGAAFALATFAHWMWFAVVGAAVMVGGAVVLVSPWLRSKGEGPLVRPIAERGQWAPRRSRNPSE
jgi:hypothetical protein